MAGRDLMSPRGGGRNECDLTMSEPSELRHERDAELQTDLVQLMTKMDFVDQEWTAVETQDESVGRGVSERDEHPLGDTHDEQTEEEARAFNEERYYGQVGR